MLIRTQMTILDSLGIEYEVLERYRGCGDGAVVLARLHDVPRGTSRPEVRDDLRGRIPVEVAVANAAKCFHGSGAQRFRSIFSR